MPNKFGLKREIPSGVRRVVRQRCGFGCVVCGSAIFEYDHFDPEFKNATSHEAEGIALLCPTDHSRKGKGLLSNVDYLDHIADPYALNLGYSYTDWSLASFAPQILIGSFTFTGGTSILQIGDRVILGFEPPELEGAPPRLSFDFRDRKGNEIFHLKGNEIRCDASAFDIDASGPQWTVRSKMYHVDLRIRFDPPTRITVEKLHFAYDKWEIKAEIGKFELLFGGQPIQTYNGGAKIDGPVFLKLAEDQPHVEMKDTEVVFGAGPAPVGSTPSKGGYSVSWPVYCPFEPKSGLHQIVNYAEDHRTLAVYLTKGRAAEESGDGWQVMPQTQHQLANLVKEYGENGIIDSVSFDPTKKMIGIRDWQEFLTNIAVPQTVSSGVELDDDDQDQDTRDTAIEFPLFLLLAAKSDTPYHEIDFAIGSGDHEALLVFSKKEDAENANEKYQTPYKVTPLGPEGFAKFLNQVVLPRRVKYLVFNPIGDGKHVERFMIIDQFLKNFHVVSPGNSLQDRVNSGEFKKL